jgi:AcrR family transcriptional regulator
MRGAETKERIGQSALRLFVEKGVTETTIRDISAAAAIAEGTIYRHYPSKDDLAWDIFAAHLSELGTELERVQEGEKGPKAKLEAMIRHFCDEFDRNPLAFRYLFLSRHGHLQRVPPHMPNPCRVFRHVIRDGIESGKFRRQNPDVATSMVMGIIFQLTDANLLGRPVAENLRALADGIVGAAERILEP